MRKLLILATLLTASLFIGCGDKDNPAGASSSPIIGTWEYAMSVLGMEMKVAFKFNANNTFETTTSMMGTVSDQGTGTWTATADSVTMVPTSCKSANEATGVLETSTCEAGQTIPINISGNTWTMTSAAGSMAFTKK